MLSDENKVFSLQNFLDFLDKSPTAWHAVEQAKEILLNDGFIELQETERWRLSPGKRYFVIRNGSSLCAFIMPIHTPFSVRLLAAHTDSPSLKIKPNAVFVKENMVMIGTEPYGSPLINSWLNRDLGIAGRISYVNEEGKVSHSLVDIRHQPLVIPQLAIHLDRKVNDDGLKLNKQEHLFALAATTDANTNSLNYLDDLLQKSVACKKVLDHDLFLFPLEKPAYAGQNESMIASYRLDNLAGMYAALMALINSHDDQNHIVQMAVFWDNEEIGSDTMHGAGSPFLTECIERIALAAKIDREGYFCLIQKSLCVSVDLGHALHPNYNDRHEPRHPLLLNKGVIMKYNAQQRYATDSVSAAFIYQICQENNLPIQKFVTRTDIPAGSTIGPITASALGMKTVDLGISQLSMHSAREIIGSKDIQDLYKLLSIALTKHEE